ncbi:hypothetical protein DERP_001864 [Dermatophagoides pteronyssinus]|uniref:Uncharacterized protein n=1 Tax=Dermatophagoides pteronyssinus TaxID=6956 RepID=A0ABQ8JC60_DERPT|nr:hypothetical protein DERP_001864 [Dermatophagoides pteronyssinus]
MKFDKFLNNLHIRKGLKRGKCPIRFISQSASSSSSSSITVNDDDNNNNNNGYLMLNICEKRLIIDHYR